MKVYFDISTDMTRPPKRKLQLSRDAKKRYDPESKKYACLTSKIIDEMPWKKPCIRADSEKQYYRHIHDGSSKSTYYRKLESERLLKAAAEGCKKIAVLFRKMKKQEQLGERIDLTEEVEDSDIEDEGIDDGDEESLDTAPEGDVQKRSNIVRYEVTKLKELILKLQDEGLIFESFENKERCGQILKRFTASEQAKRFCVLKYYEAIVASDLKKNLTVKAYRKEFLKEMKNYERRMVQYEGETMEEIQGETIY